MEHKTIQRLAFPLVTISTLGFLVPVIVFAGKDVVLKGVTIADFQELSAAALVFSVLALISVFTIGLARTRFVTVTWLSYSYVNAAGALIGLISAILTADIFVLQSTNPARFPSSELASPTTQIALWALATVSQVTFYALCFILDHFQARPTLRRRNIPAPLTTLAEKKLQIAPMRPKTPPTPLRMVAPHYALPQAQSGSPLHIPTTPRRKSWQESLANLHQVVRPSSGYGKDQPIMQSHTARSSVSSDTKSIAASDTFADWWEQNAAMNSSPETHTRDMLSSTSPHTLARSLLVASTPFATALEPIPGSRPVSPARTIDVIEQMVSESRESSEIDRSSDILVPISPSIPNDTPCRRPDTSYSMQSISAAIIATTPNVSRPPTAYSKSSVQHSNSGRRLSSGTPHRSPSISSISSSSPHMPHTSPFILQATRPSSAASSSNEAHIHPLFRTDSPTPPPNMSPGTVVHASRIAGTVLPRSMSPMGSVRRSRSKLRDESRRSSGRMTPTEGDGLGVSVEKGERVSAILPNFVLREGGLR
jgi:hypothetical protein